MTRITAAILLILSGPLVLAQTQLWALQPGIKSIVTIQVRGDSTAVDSTVKNRMHFDEQGRLIEMDYIAYQIHYEYTSDSTMIYACTDAPDCKKLYKIKREEEQISFRIEEVAGSSGCPYPPSPMIFGSLNVDSLFEDIPKTQKLRGKEYALSLRVFGEQDGEYRDLTYYKMGARLQLSSIVDYDKIGDDWYVQRVLYPSYDDKIILERQRLYDQAGQRKTQLSDEEWITEVDPAWKNKYEYQRDTAGNWIAHKPKQPNPERIWFTIREIEYWD